MANSGEGPRAVNPFSMAWRGRLAQFFFLMTLFSFPIFSVPCDKGTCSSAIEVVVSFLHHQGLVNKGALKCIAYPAALLNKVESIVGDSEDFSLPLWDNLLDRFRSEEAAESHSADIVLLAGSILCLLGALLSAVGPSYVSLAGMAVLLWYIFIEASEMQDVYALPMFTLALICSLGCLSMDGLIPKPKSSGNPPRNASFHKSNRKERFAS
eukprot:TRINITY_DN1438_c0_g1_i1.p1 TRINITY_DN1438_c0_g1~~TRINITY_DN1438_c0_g1_i1.p1  ORF type:complete len:220 (-),score=17.45 TRINITY_DN1438_c0_g1_i1:73-705(-)